MENNEGALQVTEESALGRIVITQSQVELIKNTVAKGASDDELKLFFYECRRRGVHPLDRLIHFVKRGQGEQAKVAFQCGIDFMRSQAEASGEYRGQYDVEYGKLIPLKGHKDIEVPEWAKATVKRRDPVTGEILYTTATAYWEEFYPGDSLGFMWRKMPRLMLGKVAESQALRKAFPRILQGLYSFEEMEQADIVERPAIAPPQSKSEKGNGGVKDPEAPATDAQIKAIQTLFGKYSPKSTEDEKHLYAAELLKREGIMTFKDLTKGEASSLIEHLQGLVNA